MESGGNFGIPVHDGGTSYISIKFCPWCGRRLTGYGTRSTPTEVQLFTDAEERVLRALDEPRPSAVRPRIRVEDLDRAIEEYGRGNPLFTHAQISEQHPEQVAIDFAQAMVLWGDWTEVGMGVTLPPGIPFRIIDGRRYVNTSDLESSGRGAAAADNTPSESRLEKYIRQMRRAGW